jgi:hypothetical protein
MASYVVGAFAPRSPSPPSPPSDHPGREVLAHAGELDVGFGGCGADRRGSISSRHSILIWKTPRTIFLRFRGSRRPDGLASIPFGASRCCMTRGHHRAGAITMGSSPRARPSSVPRSERRVTIRGRPSPNLESELLRPDHNLDGRPSRL